MAILIPASCGRFTVPSRAQVRMRVSASANQLNFRRDSVDWMKETSSFFEEDKRPIMLFDGVCNLCNGGVKFVRDHDQNRSIRFEALQSEAGKKLLMRSGRAPDDISSVVLVEKDRFVRDFMYDNVANNRYAMFGRSDSCEI